MKKIISTENAPKAIGPYSQAILVDNTLYCSGQIAINPQDGMLITSDILAETNQVMQNLAAVLEEAEMTFENVVKCSKQIERCSKNIGQSATSELICRFGQRISIAYGLNFTG